MQYIWQLPAWHEGAAPSFEWDEEPLHSQLERVRLQQRLLLGQSQSLTVENQATHLDTLVPVSYTHLTLPTKA